MTKDKIDFDGLIADCNSILEDRNSHFTEQTLIECVRALKAAKAQSEAVEKFDVLEHLRNGGKIYRPGWSSDQYWRIHDGELKWHAESDGVSDGTVKHLLFTFTDWQPYEEPPLPQPEPYKLYLIEGRGVFPLRWTDENKEAGTFVWNDQYGPVSNQGDVKPLRNPETNELYEVTVPDLKGGKQDAQE